MFSSVSNSQPTHSMFMAYQFFLISGMDFCIFPDSRLELSLEFQKILRSCWSQRGKHVLCDFHILFTKIIFYKFVLNWSVLSKIFLWKINSCYETFTLAIDCFSGENPKEQVPAFKIQEFQFWVCLLMWKKQDKM